MQKILVHDAALKPIAVVPLDDGCMRYLHDCHTVQIPLPCKDLTAVLDDAAGAIPKNTNFQVVILTQVQTTVGWQVITPSPVELIMRLPGAVKAEAPTAVDTLQKALYTRRRSDEVLNEAYQKDQLMAVFSPVFYDEIRADPGIRSLLQYSNGGVSQNTLAGVRYLVDPCQDVPIKFVMEV